jgi:hypothetical protein
MPSSQQVMLVTPCWAACKLAWPQRKRCRRRRRRRQQMEAWRESRRESRREGQSASSTSAVLVQAVHVRSEMGLQLQQEVQEQGNVMSQGSNSGWRGLPSSHLEQEI